MKSFFGMPPKMAPPGLPLEMYNHLGRYHAEKHGKAVDSAGLIIESGASTLDVLLENVLEMMETQSTASEVNQSSFPPFPDGPQANDRRCTDVQDAWQQLEQERLKEKQDE